MRSCTLSKPNNQFEMSTIYISNRNKWSRPRILYKPEKKLETSILYLSSRDCVIGFLGKFYYHKMNVILYSYFFITICVTFHSSSENVMYDYWMIYSNMLKYLYVEKHWKEVNRKNKGWIFYMRLVLWSRYNILFFVFYIKKYLI